MCIKQLYNDNLRKLPNENGDISVMYAQCAYKIINILDVDLQLNLS